jgi:hypothetical protein
MDEKERNALEILRNTLMTSEARIYEHVTTTFRWLMATLFTANGGGALALVNHGSNIDGSRAALGWFAVGVILALLMGVLSTFVAFRSSVAIMDARMHVERGLITDELPNAAVVEFTTKQKPTWKTWMPSFAGIGSLICFVGGAATVAAALIR